MTIDKIIALATSIGACLTAMAAFLAVWQGSKQSKASYKPELVIPGTHFQFSSNGTILTNWLNSSNDQPDPAEQKIFSLPLQNVGLGAAKAVTVTWYFPIKEMIVSVNNLAQKALIPTYYECIDEVIVVVKSDIEDGKTSYDVINQKVVNIDFVLPATIEQSTVKLAIPQAFIQIVSAIVCFSTKAKDFKSFTNIQTLKAEIVYYDIGDAQHKSVFQLEVKIVNMNDNCEKFKGYIESRYLA